MERPVYWCPRENRPIGREQERVTVPTKEITLEKDVANIYDLVATSIRINVGEEEKRLSRTRKLQKKWSMLKNFIILLLLKQNMEFLFRAMRIYQRKYLNMRRRFRTKTVANPTRNRTESTFSTRSIRGRRYESGWVDCKSNKTRTRTDTRTEYVG